MISAEYGWGDTTIFDLTVARFRQIIAAIDMRLKQQLRVKAHLVEWETKTLAIFIAGTVQVDKGKSNPLLKAAEKIKLPMNFDDEESEEDAAAEDPDVFVEQGSQKVKARPGSFEAFERTMGGPSIG